MNPDETNEFQKHPIFWQCFLDTNDFNNIKESNYVQDIYTFAQDLEDNHKIEEVKDSDEKEYEGVQNFDEEESGDVTNSEEEESDDFKNSEEEESDDVQVSNGINYSHNINNINNSDKGFIFNPISKFESTNGFSYQPITDLQFLPNLRDLNQDNDRYPLDENPYRLKYSPENNFSNLFDIELQRQNQLFSKSFHNQSKDRSSNPTPTTTPTPPSQPTPLPPYPSPSPFTPLSYYSYTPSPISAYSFRHKSEDTTIPTYTPTPRNTSTAPQFTLKPPQISLTPPQYTANKKSIIHNYLSDHSTQINPKGACIFIGDIHAQFSKLESLLRNIQGYIIGNISQEAWDNATFVFLGDYADRGIYAKETIEFLSTIDQKKLRDQQFYFILGNHDFALMSFLELVPKPLITNNPEPYDLTQFIQRGDTFWRPKNERDIKYIRESPMLAQGYRYPIRYQSENTFKSYKVPFGRKIKFMKTMPENHKQFYRSLDWIRVLNIPNRGYAICIHGGLLPDESAISQINDLFSKKLYGRIRQISCRKEVLPPPPDIKFNDICLVSGHHNIAEVVVGPSRLIIDTCGGKNDRKLSGVILPPSTNRVNSFLDGYAVIQSSE